MCQEQVQNCCQEKDFRIAVLMKLLYDKKKEGNDDGDLSGIFRQN